MAPATPTANDGSDLTRVANRAHRLAIPRPLRAADIPRQDLPQDGDAALGVLFDTLPNSHPCGLEYVVHLHLDGEISKLTHATDLYLTFADRTSPIALAEWVGNVPACAVKIVLRMLLSRTPGQKPGDMRDLGYFYETRIMKQHVETVEGLRPGVRPTTKQSDAIAVNKAYAYAHLHFFEMLSDLAIPLRAKSVRCRRWLGTSLLRDDLVATATCMDYHAGY